MPRLFLIFSGFLLSGASIMAAGCLIAPRTPLPRAVRFATGAVPVSLGVFALLACGAGYLAVYAALAALLIGLAWRSRAAVAPSGSPRSLAPLPRMSWFFLTVVAAYGAMYLVFALAPEIQPDAAGYHLRLVSGYAGLHALSGRVAFYDVLPQAMEMLFVPAFALGGGPAAKLVHLSFLVAAVSILREIARECGFGERVGSTAAALYFLAPVCGVAGTAAYTDAGLVCAVCAALYLLLRRDRERLPSLLLCAALHIGVCYAIKPLFGWAAVPALGFVIWRGRRVLPSVAFASLVLLVALPWILRAWWLTGDPFAPFLSAWFPNPVSTPDLESTLAAGFSAFRPGFAWRMALLNYTVTGGNQGLLGAGFLLLPLVLLSLRHRAGRWLVGAAALLAIPVAANTGTRFLLPALAPASVALAAVLPGPVAIAVVALQAVSAAPPLLELYDGKREWKLGRIPFAAAFGLTGEEAYLAQALPGFDAVRLIADNTRSTDKILDLAPVPEAYIPRDLLVYWHSNRALSLTDALDFARMSHGTRARVLSRRWSPGAYRMLRLTALSNLRVVDAGLMNGAAPAPSWAELLPGQTLSLAAGPAATGADLLIWPGDQARERTGLLSAAGIWETVEAERGVRYIDVRRDATAYIRRSGYRYILIPVAGDAFAGTGSDMSRYPVEWGVETAGCAGNICLFRILPDLI